MKIDIIGWFNMKNIGDEAFATVFSDIFHDQEVRFVTPGDHPLQPTPNVAILGGGAVVSPFYLKMLPPDCPRYAVGVDLAYESEVELLDKVNFRAIYVRHKSDLASIKGKVSCPVHYIPDLAFYIMPTAEDVIGHYIANPKKVVGVFVSDYINPAIDRPINDGFAEKSWSFIKGLARQLDLLVNDGWQIMLMPCSTDGYGDDRRMNLNLMAFMKNRKTVVNVMDTLTPQKMITLIS